MITTPRRRPSAARQSLEVELGALRIGVGGTADLRRVAALDGNGRILPLRVAVHTPAVEEHGLTLRASDADRERIVDDLRLHVMAGRISADEFEHRIERAYAASTVGELVQLTADLPRSRPAPAVQAGRRATLPGSRSFAVRFESEASPQVVISEAMRTFAGDLLRVGFRVERSDATRLVFTRERRPFWTIAAAILIPVFGLLALLAADRDVSQVVVSATELDRGRTVVDIFGVAPGRVRRAMAQLEQSG